MTERIVIVGAGFAGMWSALAAARAVDRAGRAGGSVEIVLIAPEPELHVRPRFYESEFSAMRAPLRDVFDAAGVRYVQGLVERIRPAEHRVEAVDARGDRFDLAYARLVLAAGSQVYRPDVPGLREHGLSIDRLDEAAELDAHLVALGDRPEAPGRDTIVVVGGGFTGIEIAAELPARLRAMHGREFDVLVIERAEAIGPDLGPGPRPVIEEALRDQGVAWRVGTAVVAIDAGGVTTSAGERIETQTVIWTAGLRASPLTAEIQERRATLGRLHVERDLRVIGAADVFACGDVAFAATDDHGNHALMSCQHAMNMGRFAGHNAAADLLGLATMPYSQPLYVTCLDLGPWGAVYTEGWKREVKMAGADAKALKRRINREWIYPPRADRGEIFAAADPARVVVA